MAKYQLAESRTVVLDGKGSAAVLGIGPVRYGESWVIHRFSVNAPAKCRVTVHRGYGVDPTTQIDATNRGDLDTSETNIALQSGEQISIKWSNGTPGNTCIIRIEGDRILAGR